MSCFLPKMMKIEAVVPVNGNQLMGSERDKRQTEERCWRHTFKTSINIKGKMEGRKGIDSTLWITIRCERICHSSLLSISLFSRHDSRETKETMTLTLNDGGMKKNKDTNTKGQKMYTGDTKCIFFLFFNDIPDDGDWGRGGWNLPLFLAVMFCRQEKDGKKKRAQSTVSSIRVCWGVAAELTSQTKSSKDSSLLLYLFLGICLSVSFNDLNSFQDWFWDWFARMNERKRWWWRKV